MNYAYQLDFLTPGISPRNANKRKSMRDMPNRLKNPRVRPETRHRFLTRLGLALRGSACSFRCASIRSSKEAPGFRITSFRFARWCAYCSTTAFRLSFLMMQLFLAIGPSFPQGVKLREFLLPMHIQRRFAFMNNFSMNVQNDSMKGTFSGDECMVKRKGRAKESRQKEP